MTRPRVLFLTDDRESYALGNYYLAYQRAFLRAANTELCHPLAPLPTLEGFDLIVLGHAAIEHYARMRGARFIPARLREHLWLRHAGLRALRRTRAPVVLFTKNDYKHFRRKRAFIRYLAPRLILTHTRSALAHLRTDAPGEVRWLPFGVDTEVFTRGSEAARFVLGFRANANSDWNGGERARFFAALNRLEGRQAVSLTLSRNGEGFLVGAPYVEWLRSCQLLGNSVSAAGTVGPRFLEAIACGAVPLAPRGPYEELLVADRDYLAVDPGPNGDFPGLESAVEHYLAAPELRDRLHAGGESLVVAHNVSAHIAVLFRDLGLSP